LISFACAHPRTVELFTCVQDSARANTNHHRWHQNTVPASGNPGLGFAAHEQLEAMAAFAL
jgi:hypothetical protein